jgi:hypothetical protein
MISVKFYRNLRKTIVSDFDAFRWLEFSKKEVIGLSQSQPNSTVF